MKPSSGTQTRKVLDAHVLQHRLKSTEVFSPLMSHHRGGVRNSGNPPNIPSGPSISKNHPAGAGPQTPRPVDSGHPCQTGAVRASITSSSFSPPALGPRRPPCSRLLLTHDKVLGSEGDKGYCTKLLSWVGLSVTIT